MAGIEAETIRKINILTANSLGIGTGNLVDVSGNFLSRSGNSGRFAQSGTVHSSFTLRPMGWGTPADQAGGAYDAARMLGVHETAMECLQQARLPAQTPTGRDTNLKHAVKFMGLFTKQLEALDRLRGKGQQKMTVERVNVESGGQAIVGHVHASPSWAKRDTDVKAAAAEEILEHEPSDAVNSGSSK